MKKAIIYTQPDCPRCDHVKNTLLNLGYELGERRVDALVRGDHHDNEALTELAMNDGEVPVVVIGDRAFGEGEPMQFLKENSE